MNLHPEVGKAEIDDIVVDRRAFEMAGDNLCEQLVLWRNHTHVRDVMVGGTWRVRDGEVLGADLDAMRAATREQAERLWAR